MIESILEFIEEQGQGMFIGGALILVLFGVFGASLSSPSHPASAPIPATTSTDPDWFTKYGTLVCEQRGADLHKMNVVNGGFYYLCQDKKTKVLSDFD